MGIGADWDAYATLGGEAVPAPVEVEAAGVGVQLDGHAKLTGALDDRSRSAHSRRAAAACGPSGGQESSSRGSPSRESAVASAPRAAIEVAVNRGDDEVEGRQRLVVVVQRAVAQDVALGAFEDAERAGRTPR